MKYKGLNRLANVLIGLGVVLLATGLIYEAANYPWRVLLERLGISVSQELPDPKPLDAAVYTAFPPEPEASAEPLDADALPDKAALLAARPQIEDLTLIGFIKLPKIGITENIVERTGDELLYGVGHMEGTAYPGQPGNCVLAGHRNYIVMHPFRHLDKLGEGDRIILSDENNDYTYEVFRTLVVEPTDTWVAEPQEDEEAMVTLITCTPVFTYTHRLIVMGRLTETAPRSAS